MMVFGLVGIGRNDTDVGQLVGLLYIFLPEGRCIPILPRCLGALSLTSYEKLIFFFFKPQANYW